MKVKFNDVVIGEISKGEKYWEYIPVGGDSPTLRAHGEGGLKLTIKKWLGNNISFEL